MDVYCKNCKSVWVYVSQDASEVQETGCMECGKSELETFKASPYAKQYEEIRSQFYKDLKEMIQ